MSDHEGLHRGARARVRAGKIRRRFRQPRCIAASRDRRASVSAALERQFRRVVPIVAAASLMLAAYNWWGGRDSASSPLEAALNLPRISLSSAYSTSTLVDATNIPLGTP